MNNENNNFNGTVLGNINPDNNNPYNNNNMMAPDNIETLNPSPEPSEGLGNNDGIQEGGQFFNTINNASENTNNGTMPNSTYESNDYIQNPNNPNEINGMAFGSMPGFENPNTIGITPPLSLNQNQNNSSSPKKSNKIVFIILIVVILLAIGGGTYYVLKYTSLFKAKESIQITTKEVEINLNSELPDDNALAQVTGTTLDKCTIDKSKIDITKEGSYEFTVNCSGNIKSGTVKVVNNVPLALKSIYKAVGNTIEAKEFALNEANELTYEFVNPSEVTEYLKNPGEYDITIKATSADNRAKEGIAKLYVTKDPIRGFLACTTNLQNISGTSISMQESDRFGISINDQKVNVYSGLAFINYTFIFGDETEYNTYVTDYNTKGEITINNITSKDVTFASDSKTITMIIKVDNESLYNSYGEEHFNSYTDILSYYSNTLGRNCVYSK